MREKACELVCLDCNRYISLHSLKVFYWAIIIIPFIMVTLGIAAINTVGVNWKSMFPLISIVTWSLIYWTFVLTVQSRRTKKTFELRFIVNGISGLLLSSLFWILYTSVSLLDDNSIVGFYLSLCILFVYLFFSAVYIGLVVLGVHKGFFKKIKEKSKTPKALAISSLFAAILPCTGILGMYTSKMLRQYASISVQNFVGLLAFVLIIFLPILGHVNFVQYFYCKKYKIICDEHGNTTSPDLCAPQKEKRTKSIKKELDLIDTSNSKDSKKKIPLGIKVLFGILGVPIAFFIIVFLIFFIKGFIQEIS